MRRGGGKHSGVGLLLGSESDLHRLFTSGICTEFPSFEQGGEGGDNTQRESWKIYIYIYFKVV